MRNFEEILIKLTIYKNLKYIVLTMAIKIPIIG